MNLLGECERLCATMDGRVSTRGWQVTKAKLRPAGPGQGVFECQLTSTVPNSQPLWTGFKTLLPLSTLHGQLKVPEAPFNMLPAASIENTSDKPTIDSWSTVTNAIGRMALRVGHNLGVEVASAGGRRGDNGASLFAVTTVNGRNALTMTLHPERAIVQLEAEITSGGNWRGNYRIIAENAWLGPIAPGAQPGYIVGSEAIAREILDGWLAGAVGGR